MNLPKNVKELLIEEGQNGIIISALLAWILVNRNEAAKSTWRTVAIHNWKPDEIGTAKNALKEAGGLELSTAVPNIKVVRQNGPTKAIKELDDICKAIDH